MKKFICLFTLVCFVLANTANAGYQGFLEAIEHFESAYAVNSTERPAHFQHSANLMLDLAIREGNLHVSGHLMYLYENSMLNEDQRRAFEVSTYYEVIREKHKMLEADFRVSQALMTFRYDLTQPDPLSIAQNSIFDTLLTAGNDYNCGRAWLYLHQFFTKEILFDKPTNSVKQKIAQHQISRQDQNLSYNPLFFGYLHPDAVEIAVVDPQVKGRLMAAETNRVLMENTRQECSNILTKIDICNKVKTKLGDLNNPKLWNSLSFKEGEKFSPQVWRNGAMLGSLKFQKNLAVAELRPPLKLVWERLAKCVRSPMEELIEEGHRLEQEGAREHDPARAQEYFDQAYRLLIQAENALNERISRNNRVDPSVATTLYRNIASMLITYKHPSEEGFLENADMYFTKIENFRSALQEEGVGKEYMDMMAETSYFRGIYYHKKQDFQNALNTFNTSFFLDKKEAINWIMDILLHPKRDLVYTETQLTTWSQAFIEKDPSNAQHLAAFWISKALKNNEEEVSLFLLKKGLKYLRKYFSQYSLKDMSPKAIEIITEYILHKFEPNYWRENIWQNVPSIRDFIRTAEVKCGIKGAVLSFEYNQMIENLDGMEKCADSILKAVAGASLEEVVCQPSSMFTDSLRKIFLDQKNLIAKILNSLGHSYTQKGDHDSDIKAVSLLKKAAQLKDYLAMYNLSILYAQGRGGLEANLDNSIKCLRMALPSGDIDVLNNLGVHLFEKLQQTENPEIREALFTESQRYLSIAYDEGNGFAAVNAFLHQLYYFIEERDKEEKEDLKKALLKKARDSALYLREELRDVIRKGDTQYRKVAALYLYAYGYTNFNGVWEDAIPIKEMEELARILEFSGVNIEDELEKVTKKPARQKSEASDESSTAAASMEEDSDDGRGSSEEDTSLDRQASIDTIGEDDSSAASSSVRLEVQRAAKKLKKRIGFEQLQKIMADLGIESSSKSHRPHGRDVGGKMANRLQSAREAMQEAYEAGSLTDAEFGILME